MSHPEISEATAERMRHAGIDLDNVTVLKTHRNPWGVVPITGGGAITPDDVTAFMDRVRTEAAKRDCKSRKHHYVPRAYLQRWAGHDGLLRCTDLTAGVTRDIPPKTTFRINDFYRVIGPEKSPHNQVESILSVLDDEMAKTLTLFNELRPGDDVTFDQFVTLGLVVSLQHLRTPQARRLSAARADWLAQQYAQAKDPQLGVDYDLRFVPNTEMQVSVMFDQMWDMTDEMIRREIHIYDDPQGRIPTCDAPVIVPLNQAGQPGLNAGFIDIPRIWWPISPHRALCLDFDTVGEKVQFRKMLSKDRDALQDMVLRGRETFIIPAPGSHDMPTWALLERTQFSVECVGVLDDGSCRVMFERAYGKAPRDRTCGRHKRLLRADLHS